MLLLWLPATPCRLHAREARLPGVAAGDVPAADGSFQVALHAGLAGARSICVAGAYRAAQPADSSSRPYAHCCAALRCAGTPCGSCCSDRTCRQAGFALAAFLRADIRCVQHGFHRRWPGRLHPPGAARAGRRPLPCTRALALSSPLPAALPIVAGPRALAGHVHCAVRCL